MFNHAVILAAGRGMRLMPLSKKIPKAMVKVKNETLILNGIKKVLSLLFCVLRVILLIMLKIVK